MNKQKTPLDEKINDGANTDGWHKVLYVEDVRESIKNILERIWDKKVIRKEHVEEIIKQEVGELAEGKENEN